MDKILLLIKVPPPITGATLSNQRVYDSKLLRKSFIIESILISYANNIADLGNINVKKVLVFVHTFIKLLKVLLFDKPALVYFQISPLGFAFYRDIIIVLLIKLNRVKLLYHLRGKGIKEASKNKIKRILYKVAFRNTSIISLAPILSFDIEDVFFGSIYIVNNGLPDINPRYLTNNKKQHNDRINILFLSNLIKSKGIVDFVQALKLLDNKGIDFNATIVGAEGDFTENELSSIITDANITNKVNYLGAKYAEEKDHIISLNDILVFPTKNDIWGNVIIEAMQFGLPVIATIEGAIPEIIDDVITGFLVEKNSPDQIADKIEIFVKNPSLIESMGKAARKKYEEKYTLEIFEKNMKEVFDKVLQEVNGEKNV